MASNTSSKIRIDHLVNILEELREREVKRFKTLLSAQQDNKKVPVGQLEKATTSDELAELLVSRYEEPYKCLPLIKDILQQIPRRDIIGDDRFKHLFNMELKTMTPFKARVDADVLSAWKHNLAYKRDTTTSISLMKKLVQYSDSVGIIGQSRTLEGIKGSGFRVGSKFFITNFHVLKMMLGGDVTEERLQQLTGDLVVYFNYETILQEGLIYDKVRAISFYSENPDYVICELDLTNASDGCHRLPGLDGAIGSLTCPDGSFISLIGHPGARPKQMDGRCLIFADIGKVAIEIQDALNGHVGLFGDTDMSKYEELLVDITKPHGIAYQSSFLRGASGSPGFDDNGRLVIIHTLGYFVPSGSERSIIERGLSMDVIRQHLWENDQDLAAQVFRS